MLRQNIIKKKASIRGRIIINLWFASADEKQKLDALFERLYKICLWYNLYSVQRKPNQIASVASEAGGGGGD